MTPGGDEKKPSLGVVVLTQGGYARALTASAAHILGDAPAGVRAVGIKTGDTPAAIESKLRAALQKAAHGGRGALILCDIFGATPANIARKIAAERDDVACAFGVNLPMLLEALAFRAAAGGAKTLATRVAAAAKRAVCAQRNIKK